MSCTSPPFRLKGALTYGPPPRIKVTPHEGPLVMLKGEAMKAADMRDKTPDQLRDQLAA